MPIQLLIVLTSSTLCLLSPANHEKKLLEMIGKKLKKNNVALDIIDFGEEDDAKPEKLEALLSAVNSNDSSHIVHVPSGPNALSDVLIRSVALSLSVTGGNRLLLLSFVPYCLK